MRLIIYYFKKHLEIIVTLLVVAGIYMFISYKWNWIKRNGVVTVAKVLKYEPAESGSALYIEIYLRGNKFEATIDQSCQADCIGNFFFVRVNPNHPDDYPIFYGDRQVPSCIIDSITNFSGWDSIPSCGIRDR